MSKQRGVLLKSGHFPVTCKDTGERCYDYKSYLLSKHWKNFRLKFINWKLFDNKCKCCEEKLSYFELHHITYKRLGKELLSDVIPLCGRCHEIVHETIYKMLTSRRRKDYPWDILKTVSWKLVRSQFRQGKLPKKG